MGEQDFHRLLTMVSDLSVAQCVTLDAAVRRRLAAPPSQSVDPATSAWISREPTATSTPEIAAGAITSVADLDRRFALAPACPHFGGAALIKWNKSSGLQRYRRKPCDRIFNALTGTPLVKLRKRELWLGHAQALIDGVSLRTVAARLDVDLTTLFRWRHRFLKQLQVDKPNRLEGTAEADQTYFRYSEKRSCDLKRPPRKRGGTATKSGLSCEHVPVLIARDGNGTTTDAVLPDRSEASIKSVLGPVIDPAAILVSDGAKACRKFADAAHILQVELNLSAGERRWGVYHLNNTNSYDGRLKGWMRRCNGAATKYLDSYRRWHRISDAAGSTICASRMLAAA